jgi:hypothetical protein
MFSTNRRTEIETGNGILSQLDQISKDSPLKLAALSFTEKYFDEIPESRNRGVISQVTNCKSLHDNS